MDNLRGQEEIGAEDNLDYGAIEAPPPIASDERRMHVRAYNYWASLLGNRALPSIEDLNPEDMEDFAANSVLLDFSMGMDNPAILYLGSALREECGIESTIERIDQVPARSLLTRLTDHYLQIIANAAPVGFEAEFTNQRGAEILYRGILMPFSSDDETIDFIYGVINWKEAASPTMVEQLGEEMKNAAAVAAPAYPTTPIWADGPSGTADFEDEDEDEEAFPLPASMIANEDNNFGFDEVVTETDGASAEDVLDLAAFASDETAADETAEAPAEPVIDDISDILDDLGLSAPQDTASGMAPESADSFDELDLAAFVSKLEDAEQATDDEGEGDEDDILSLDMPADPEQVVEEVAADEPVEVLETAGTDLSDDIAAMLDSRERDHDLLAELDAARQGAAEALDSDARSRTALYRAIGMAYDFALSAREAPEDYVRMLDNAGITVQDRSPMTAVVKLVFGADYEKTRVAEYALALDYAVTQDLPRGGLARQLGFYEGGLKGLVRDMRDARRAEGVDPASRSVRRLDRAVRRLNRADPVDETDLPFGELGLAVVVARREPDGSISLVAGVGLQDKAAQKVMIAASKTV